MRGLILKDIFILGRYSRFLLLYLLLFGGIFVVQGNATFGSMIVVLLSSLVISTFTYDDQAHWDQYILSTPVGRKKVVLAKYLLALALVVLGTLVGLLCVLLGRMVNPGEELLQGMVPLATLGLSALVGALAVSAIIPLIYRFGTEKSRLMMMLVYALPAVLIGTLFNLIAPEQVHRVVDWFEVSLPSLLVATPLFCIAAICFSYVLSVKIYAKKEIS